MIMQSHFSAFYADTCNGIAMHQEAEMGWPVGVRQCKLMAGGQQEGERKIGIIMKM